MTTTFYNAASYKPQILSRTEGFHLPSPAPSTPPSSEATPAGTNNTSPGTNNGSSNGNNGNGFDTHNLFITPPSYLSVPETFRKFPGHPHSENSSGMDFSEEIASLIANPPTSTTSHERSTQSPPNVNAYDDYRGHTHNIFDISAPNTHHHHQPPHSPFGTGPGSSAFSLPPTSSIHSHSHSHSSNHGGPASLNSHGLHDFASHSHFNSTVPAIGSSMRYEPPPTSPFSLNHPSSHSSSSTTTANGLPGAEPSSVSSFSSHISNISSLSGFSVTTQTSDGFPHHPHHGHLANGHQRQTPSPVSATSPHPDYTSHTTSRSRSRSRTSTSNTNAVNINPPSTNGGPTRRTRAKRNSVSSVSPPPLHRHNTQPLVIPNGNGSSGATPNGRGPVSPLSIHSSNGWFISPSQHGHQGAEYSLPTPDSVHGGFSAFTGGSLPLSGVSPKEVNVPGIGNVGVHGHPMKGGESPPTDMATKQALLANEKRRRRRESHNAVERRRRDNINEKISELATLIPECLLDPTAPTSALALPNQLEGASDDVLLGNTTPIGVEKKEEEDAKDINVGIGKGDSKDVDAANGGVKANKGMILRKSVEYIRYLQQLVTVQASRNRDLEQQLQTYRSGGAPNDTASNISGVSGDGDDLAGLMLHDEVDGEDAFNLLSAAGMNGSSFQDATSHHRKAFSGFELESVEEMDLEDDHTHHAHSSTQGMRSRSHQDHDEDMDRPSTAGTGPGETSPSANSLDDDVNEELEEEERGRKGRDGGRPGICTGKSQGIMVGDVKIKEEKDMETS